MEIKLKRAYLTGKGYKNQKSKANNSGVNKHKKNTKNKRKIFGTPILLLNYSPNDLFCEHTGLKLPRNGMAWMHNGLYFKNLEAAEGYERERG
jgi:hypothetical protein